MPHNLKKMSHLVLTFTQQCQNQVEDFFQTLKIFLPLMLKIPVGLIPLSPSSNRDLC